MSDLGSSKSYLEERAVCIEIFSGISFSRIFLPINNLLHLVIKIDTNLGVVFLANLIKRMSLPILTLRGIISF